MESLAADRYRDELARGLTNVGSGKILTRRTLVPMAEGIKGK